MEKEQGAHEVIFHQDALREGQGKALEESTWFPCHIPVLTSLRVLERLGLGEGGGSQRRFSFRVFPCLLLLPGLVLEHHERSLRSVLTAVLRVVPS